MKLSAITFLVLGAGMAHGQTLDDLWAGRARFEVEKAANGADRVFGWPGMHFLSFVPNDRRGWNVYFIENSPTNNNVGLATTEDGIHFTPVGTVLLRGKPGEFDHRIASFPGVYRDRGNWFMVYEAADGSENDSGDWHNLGSVGFATSTDGKTWVKQGELLAKQEPWERQNIGTPSLVKTKNEWWVFYHGFGLGSDGGLNDCQIGVATGESLSRSSLHRVSPQPVVPTSTRPDMFDSGTVGKRSILREGKWWYLVYEASTDQVGTRSFEGARWTSGMARSRDLIHWEKLGLPVLPTTQESFGYDGPEFLRTKDRRLHIYFRIPQQPNQPGNTTGRATLAWVKQK